MMTGIIRSIKDLPDGIYMVKNGTLYSVDVETFPAETIKMPEWNIAPDDELQHVEYTSAQCGYEK